MTTLKSVIKKTHGHLAPLGPDMKVRRVMPTYDVDHVDPFVFLDHMGPVVQKPGSKSGGTGAHPHKGFCTFTYLLSGEVEHRDSRGHYGVVGPGGVQWMMAASGIVHDEKPSAAFLERGGLLHGFQLWINLPAEQKRAAPQYMPLQTEEIPEVAIGASTLRVLIGQFQGKASPIPTYSPMLVYHLRLAAGDEVTIPIDPHFGMAAYVPQHSLTSNGETLADAELGVYGHNGEELHFKNDSDVAVDVLIMGGEPIAEPIIAQGPFVMNTEMEIKAAYQEYMAGAFGEIEYA